MSSRKRSTDTIPSTSSKKRRVSINTFNSWKTQYERDYQTLSWLRCDVSTQDKMVVEMLWCDSCRKYEDAIRGMKNFSNAWITGSSNQKTSSIIDHAISEQHRVSMLRSCTNAAKASNLLVTSYSPIVRSLLVMEPTVKERMKKKFDICYVLAKENMGFRKYAALHELEERHGVDLGFAYKNDTSAKTFTHYIAESQQQCFLESLLTFNFYSFLMDGSTDAGNIEQELVMIEYCNQDDVTQEMKSCARFLSLEMPAKADADGLIDCLNNALGVVGVENILDESNVLGVSNKPVVVGGGTDGASVNIGEQNGMKGKLQEELPWLYWTWCYAHRLELACKDAFCCRLFKDIDEMMLHLYSLYSKSPKKSNKIWLKTSRRFGIFQIRVTYQ